MKEKYSNISEDLCKELGGEYDRILGCKVSARHPNLTRFKEYGKYFVRGYFDGRRPSDFIRDMSAVSSPLIMVTTGADIATKLTKQVITCRGVVKKTARNIERNELTIQQFLDREREFREKNCGTDIDFCDFVREGLFR